MELSKNEWHSYLKHNFVDLIKMRSNLVARFKCEIHGAQEKQVA